MGLVRVQKGTATCSSTIGAGNVATVHGGLADATAGTVEGAERNRAKASRFGSRATADVGDGDTA